MSSQQPRGSTSGTVMYVGCTVPAATDRELARQLALGANQAAADRDDEHAARRMWFGEVGPVAHDFLAQC